LKSTDLDLISSQILGDFGEFTKIKFNLFMTGLSKLHKPTVN